jgi:hypothetical protein
MRWPVPMPAMVMEVGKMNAPEWELVDELAQQLQSLIDSGLLNGPTVRHDKEREGVYSALSSYRDACNVAGREDQT